MCIAGADAARTGPARVSAVGETDPLGGTEIGTRAGRRDGLALVPAPPRCTKTRRLGRRPRLGLARATKLAPEARAARRSSGVWGDEARHANTQIVYSRPLTVAGRATKLGRVGRGWGS